MLKEDLSYYVKYTAGTYLDIAMSMPIFFAEKISKGLEKILVVDEESNFNWNNIKEKSLVFKKREKLRDELETLPGVLNVRSNLFVGVLMITAGIPVANFAWDLMYGVVKDSSEIVQYTTNALITIGAQFGIGYSIFMVADVHANKEKYLENKSLSARKIFNGFLKAVKSYLPFDVTYSAMKVGGQLYFLSKGKDPGYASALADTIASPLFYTISLGLGLHTGLIQIERNKDKHL